MKHIHHIGIVIVLLSIALTDGRAQGVYTDTLNTFTFTYEIPRGSVAFRSDSLPMSAMDRSTSLTEAIKHSQPMVIRDYGPGNITNLSMRGGTAQQVEWFWNGMAINTPSLGLVDVSLIPAAFLLDVQIDLGASSLLQGASGISGSIRMRSDARDTSAFVGLNSSFTPELGGMDHVLEIGDGSQAASWRTVLFHSSTDNRYRFIDDSGQSVLSRRREHARSQQQGLAQDLSIRTGKNSRLHMAAHYLHSDREIPAPIGVSGRGEQQTDEILRSIASMNWMATRTSHELSIGHVHENLHYTDTMDVIDSQIGNDRVHMHYELRTQLTGQTLVEFRWDNDLNLMDIQDLTTQSSHEMGMYLGMEKGLGKQVDLDIGIRQETRNLKWNPLTASLALSIRPKGWKRVNLIASAARTFRNPTMNDMYWPELGDASLQAEEGYSGEMHVEWNQEDVQLGIIGFANLVDQMILWVPGGDGRFRPENLDRSRSSGLEWRSCVDWSSTGGVRGSYTYVQTKEYREETGSWVEGLYRPEHMLNVEVSQALKGILFGWSLDYQSSTLTDHRNIPQSELPPIYMMDAFAQWKVPGSQSMEWGFRVNNLLNTNYEFVRDRPIPDRHVQIHLAIRFHEKT
ncbi:MAG: TonB-dependent receptor [Flavobacteriales bacterium]|nr:TonB-dependent receptor [Flavobacteriales bacterium]